MKNLVLISTGKKDANFGSENGIYDFFTCALDPIKSSSYSYDGQYIILPGNGANVGYSILYNGKFEAYQRTYLLEKINDFLLFEYLQIVLKAYWKDYNHDKQYGSAIPYIKLGNLEEFLVPIPPLEEQERIVKRIEELMPLVDEYARLEAKDKELDEKLPAMLKQSILQYAMEGKLVKQDPNDEPASVLLERIKAEKEKLIKEGKIKRDKNETVIIQDDDKNYYENLPSQWSLCRLNDLAIYKKGPFGSSLTKSMFVNKSTPNCVKVYEQKNAIQKNAFIGDYYISKEKYLLMKNFQVNPSDIIVSCAGTIGEIFLLPPNAPIGIINQALMKVTLINSSIIDYFQEILYYSLQKLAGDSKGTAIKNIPPFEILKPYLIKLPPKDEQNRIMNKLNYIRKMIDHISMY